MTISPTWDAHINHSTVHEDDLVFFGNYRDMRLPSHEGQASLRKTEHEVKSAYKASEQVDEEGVLRGY